jgi:hypothetical protein
MGLTSTCGCGSTDLGNVVLLGELESNSQAAKEHGDAVTGVGELDDLQGLGGIIGRGGCLDVCGEPGESFGNIFQRPA